MLDKYIGDGIMAVFGAPFTGEHDADNGVQVAGEMMQALARLNSRRRTEGQPAISIGVGLSCGEVVAGIIGSPRRMDYTVIGDSVNVASRLESANKIYGTNVLMCERVVNRLHTVPRLREIDLVCVRGKTQPVRVFELLSHHSRESFPNMDRVLLAFEGARGSTASAVEAGRRVLPGGPRKPPRRRPFEDLPGVRLGVCGHPSRRRLERRPRPPRQVTLPRRLR